MTDNPTLSPQRQPEDHDAALRPKSLGQLLAMSLFVAFLLGQSASVSAQTPVTRPVHVAVRLSPEMLQRGVHGTVVLRVTVSADNRIETQTVVESSGSQELDDFAQAKLAGGSVSPNLDTSEDRSLMLEVDLYAFDIGDDFGRSYSCGQAVLDHDWYLANNPDNTVEHGKYYHMFGGLALVSGRSEVAFALDPEKRERAWLTAIERCRANGERQFLGMVIAAGNGRAAP